MFASVILVEAIFGASEDLEPSWLDTEIAAVADWDLLFAFGSVLIVGGSGTRFSHMDCERSFGTL